MLRNAVSGTLSNKKGPLFCLRRDHLRYYDPAKVAGSQKQKHKEE
jgi:hypothetical protein